MARRTLTMVTDDLDGTELAEGEGATVVFSVGTTYYEIDLSTKNAAKLTKALKPYTDAARVVPAARATSSQKASRRAGRSTAQVDSTAVREWAAANGVEVSARGRVPASVLEQYHAAGN